MRRLIGLFALVLMIGSVQSINAQTFKFGHINSDELFNVMPERDTVISKLDALSKDYQNQLELMQVEFNNKYNDYVQNMNKWTDLVRQTKEEELSSMQDKINNFQQSAQNDMQQKQNEFMQPVLAKADKAIKDVAKENGFTYVFDLARGPILYFDETKSQDILPLVKAKLGIQ